MRHGGVTTIERDVRGPHLRQEAGGRAPALRAGHAIEPEGREETLRREGDPRALGRGAVFDTYEYVGGRMHSYDAWLRNGR